MCGFAHLDQVSTTRAMVSSLTSTVDFPTVVFADEPNTPNWEKLYQQSTCKVESFSLFVMFLLNVFFPVPSSSARNSTKKQGSKMCTSTEITAGMSWDLALLPHWQRRWRTPTTSTIPPISPTSKPITTLILPFRRPFLVRRCPRKRRFFSRRP